MYTLGIDIGSTTSKCVILKDGTEITATSIVVAGTGTKGPEKALKEVFEKAGITREGIGAAIATGGQGNQRAQLPCERCSLHISPGPDHY